jgi:hypothetical protein
MKPRKVLRSSAVVEHGRHHRVVLEDAPDSAVAILGRRGARPPHWSKDTIAEIEEMLRSSAVAEEHPKDDLGYLQN